VNKELLKPYGTELFISIASSKVLYLTTNKIGMNNSCYKIGWLELTSKIVG
jgi:hypothetical protein